jgi:hypothetical protein
MKKWFIMNSSLCGGHVGIADPGYSEGGADADFDGDGCKDYCRVVGDLGVYRLWCTSSYGPNAGKTFDTGPGIDPGFKNG